tara:strand:- start:612 stop:1115 length:504 start_codon:yes stop_codon:yes gene_type:complete
MPKKNKQRKHSTKQKKKRTIPKKRTKKNVGVGLVPDRRKIMEGKVKKRLEKLQESGVIDEDMLKSLRRSGDIFEITQANIDEGMNLEVDELVKYLLINSDCNYIDKTIEYMDDDIKTNAPRSFYNCVKLNRLIERVVIEQINKGFFRNRSELFRIIFESPECFDVDI